MTRGLVAAIDISSLPLDLPKPGNSYKKKFKMSGETVEAPLSQGVGYGVVVGLGVAFAIVKVICSIYIYIATKAI
jgi:hypothetical protein